MAGIRCLDNAERYFLGDDVSTVKAPKRLSLILWITFVVISINTGVCYAGHVEGPTNVYIAYGINHQAQLVSCQRWY